MIEAPRTMLLQSPFAALDFDAFHRAELPARLAAGNGRIAGRDARRRAPIAFALPDGRAYTFAAADAGIEIVPGSESAATIVELEARDWQDFVHELHTTAGLLYGRRLRFPRGSYADLELWEPALRAAFDGRPIYDPAGFELRDADGAPLDPNERFTLDDGADRLHRFLEQAGFLLVKHVFSAAEVAALARAAERLAAAATPGDRASWWARDGAGKDVLCRITYAGRRSTEVAALDDDARIRALGTLAGADLRPAPDRCDGHSIVIKNAAVVEGLSDLPWHRDCGLGGHPIMCPNVQVGIQLDHANAESGQLHFLAGSWRTSCHRDDIESAARRHVVALDTEPGDCTVHFGDAMHAAPPPRGHGPGRRALYVSFFSERVFSLIGPGQGYNDVLLSRDDGLVEATH